MPNLIILDESGKEIARVPTAAPPGATQWTPSGPIPPEPGPLPDDAAQWITTSGMIVSPDEPDCPRVGLVAGWHPLAYVPPAGSKVQLGHGYRYEAAGSWPPGLTIDPDTGVVAAAEPIPAGEHALDVKVSNRDAPEIAALHSFRLTSDPAIHYREYDADDYASLEVCCDGVRVDQGLAGRWGNLRARINLTAGRTYEYRDNNFARGISHATFRAKGNGAKPILRCVNQGSMYQNGPLGVKGGIGALAHQSQIKSLGAIVVEDTLPGASIVQLLNADEAAKLIEGRWHLIASGSIQTGGYPPNCAYVEFVRVDLIEGAEVHLDRRLRFAHGTRCWDDPNNQGILGRARIYLLDEDANRTIERLRFEGIEFQRNPNGTDEQKWRIMYCEGIIDLSFRDCVVGNCQMSMSRQLGFEGCRFRWASEFDKLGETIVIDQSHCDPGVEIGAATGYQALFLRESMLGYLQASPRQVVALGGTIDIASGNVCVAYTYYGPVLQMDLRGVHLVRGVQPGAGDRWAWVPQADKDQNFLDLASNSWGGDGHRLQIARNDPNFESWLTAMHVGLIIAGGDGLPPYDEKPWGYVSETSAPDDGSALWAQLQWMHGDKPVSGRLYRLGRWSRLDLRGASLENVGWNDPRFAKQISGGLGPGWDFPAGYPFA